MGPAGASAAERSGRGLERRSRPGEAGGGLPWLGGGRVPGGSPRLALRLPSPPPGRFRPPREGCSRPAAKGRSGATGRGGCPRGSTSGGSRARRGDWLPGGASFKVGFYSKETEPGRVQEPPDSRLGVSRGEPPAPRPGLSPRGPFGSRPRPAGVRGRPAFKVLCCINRLRGGDRAPPTEPERSRLKEGGRGWSAREGGRKEGNRSCAGSRCTSPLGEEPGARPPPDPQLRAGAGATRAQRRGGRDPPGPERRLDLPLGPARPFGSLVRLQGPDPVRRHFYLHDREAVTPRALFRALFTRVSAGFGRSSSLAGAPPRPGDLGGGLEVLTGATRGA